MNHRQQGQTLIETLVAVFILIMGIVAALVLSKYALYNATSIKEQAIGVGLAREGIEVVKNMRDTNWLRATMNTNCHNFSVSTNPNPNDAICFRDWLNPQSDFGHNRTGYSITAGDYYLTTVPSSINNVEWSLVSTNDSLQQYGLDLQTFINAFNPEFYVHSPTAGSANSGFYRKITIENYNTTPFDQLDIGPRLKVTSIVWWADSNCPASNVPPTKKSCKVELSTYLTNWKNYNVQATP